jgi:hypothetical protein
VNTVLKILLALILLPIAVLMVLFTIGILAMAGVIPT